MAKKVDEYKTNALVYNLRKFGGISRDGKTRNQYIANIAILGAGAFGAYELAGSPESKEIIEGIIKNGTSIFGMSGADGTMPKLNYNNLHEWVRWGVDQASMWIPKVENTSWIADKGGVFSAASHYLSLVAGHAIASVRNMMSPLLLFYLNNKIGITNKLYNATIGPKLTQTGAKAELKAAERTLNKKKKTAAIKKKVRDLTGEIERLDAGDDSGSNLEEELVSG
jgi:hypothetical protein